VRGWLLIGLIAVGAVALMWMLHDVGPDDGDDQW
jgi:hypothetical protein